MPDPPYPKPDWVHDKDSTDKWETQSAYIPPGTHRVDLSGTFPVIEVLTSIANTGPGTWGSYVWERLGISPGPIAGATVESPVASSVCVLRAPSACTVTQVRAWQNTGTGCVVNAFRGSLAAPLRFLSTNLTIASADSWASQSADQNTAVSAGDAIYIEIVTVAGSPDRLAVQIEMTRP